jgi:type III secretion protein J
MTLKRLNQLSKYLLFVLFIFPLLTSCTKSQNIVNNLEEREANEVMVFLKNRGISAQKIAAAASKGGGGDGVALYSIAVHPNSSIKAMSLLSANGLPRRRSTNLLSIFSKGGLVPSAMDQKIKFQEGLAEQISGTIRQIDGVLDAVIQLSFPEEELIPGANAVKKQKTASVYVKHDGILDDPNSQLVTKIRRLVSSSIEGLTFNNVTVIPDRARFRVSSQSGGLGNGADQEKNFVKLWGIIVGKDSVTRFRVVFFSFVTIIILLLLSLLWTLYKTFPLIMRAGGPKALLSLQPLTIAKSPTSKESDGDDALSQKSQEREKRKTKAGIEDDDKSVEDEAADLEDED